MLSSSFLAFTLWTSRPTSFDVRPMANPNSWVRKKVGIFCRSLVFLAKTICPMSNCSKQDGQTTESAWMFRSRNVREFLICNCIARVLIHIRTEGRPAAEELAGILHRFHTNNRKQMVHFHGNVTIPPLKAPQGYIILGGRK